MNHTNANRLAGIVLLIVVLCLAGCAAGDARFTEDGPAGFFAGFWHGLILVVAFVISLFNDAVHIYETNNSGSLYDLGFVLGAAAALRGTVSWKKKKSHSPCDHGKLEKKIKVAIRTWVEEKGEKDPEWKEIAEKVGDKVKREIRKWAEEE